MRIVCLSDVHSKQDRLQVPDGDLLLVAGDLTKRGTEDEIRRFDDWLARLPHPHKVVIAGNHDFLFEHRPSEARRLITAAVYLEDELVEVGGLRVWGSPWQPRFFDWAFNLDRGEPLREKWAAIPPGIDVLLTHGPPYGILDRVAGGDHVGCQDLLEAVERVRPRWHVFGHIHEAYGVVRGGATTFVNASTCTLSYAPSNPPVVVEHPG